MGFLAGCEADKRPGEEVGGRNQAPMQTQDAAPEAGAESDGESASNSASASDLESTENPLDLHVETVKPAGADSLEEKKGAPTYRLTYRPKPAKAAKAARARRAASSFSLAPGEAPEDDAEQEEDLLAESVAKREVIEVVSTPKNAASTPLGAPHGVGIRVGQRRAAALDSLFARGAKEEQTFQVDTDLDTVLTGAQGTRIWIPAAAFVDSVTGQPVTGPVEFQVKEFLTLADMVLNNLSTTSGDRLLETAGMVKLTATQNGRPLRLLPGTELTVALPRTGPEKPGMEVFGGSGAGASTPAADGPGVDWRLGGGRVFHADEPGKPLKKGDPKKLKMPLLPKEFTGNRRKNKLLGKKLGFTSATAKALANQQLTPKERAWLNRTRRRMRPYRMTHDLVDVVEMTYLVGRDGIVRDLRCVGGNTPALVAAVDSAIRQKWRGRSSSYRTLHKAQYYFFRGGYAQVSDQFTGMYERNAADSLRQARLDRLRQLPVELQDEADKAEIAESYLMSVSQLGWINCDRFTMVREKDLTDLRLAVPPGSDVRLVFREIRSVMNAAWWEEGTVVFLKIPKGALVTVLAFAAPNGKAQLATQQLVVGEPVAGDWNFRPVTTEVLKEELKKLE